MILLCRISSLNENVSSFIRQHRFPHTQDIHSLFLIHNFSLIFILPCILHLMHSVTLVGLSCLFLFYIYNNQERITFRWYRRQTSSSYRCVGAAGRAVRPRAGLLHRVSGALFSHLRLWQGSGVFRVLFQVRLGKIALLFIFSMQNDYIHSLKNFIFFQSKAK